MRLSLPAVVLSLSALSSATFFWAQEDSAFPVGEANTLSWDTADFDDNIDIYVGPEDADEEKEGDGVKIATDYPNSGTFTWTPDNKDGEGKKKIWGKDKKGKKSKGKKLIIIIIKKPGEIFKHPGEVVTTPVVIPPPQTQLPPTATLTSIATITHITASETIVTKTLDTPKNPPVETPKNPPTVVIPTVIAPLPTTSVTRPPVIITATGSRPGGNGTFVPPTATTGTSPPIFTGAAYVEKGKPLVAGGLMGLLALALL